MVTDRRQVLTIMLLLLAIALTGCWDNRDPRNRAFVTALGDDGLLEVTFQIPAAGQLRGSAGGGGGKQNQVAFTTVTGRGENFAEGFARAQASVSRELYLGQMNLLVFGRRLVAKGLQPLTLELARTPEAVTCFYAMADRAKEALATAPSVEPVPGVYIRSFFESVEVRGRFLQTRMWKLYRGLITPGRDPFMPVMETTGGATRLAGTAVLRGDRLAAVLDEEESRGLAWLLTGTRREALTVKVGGRAYALRHIESRVTTRVHWEGNRPAARAYVRITAEVSAPWSHLDSETLNRVEAALSNHVQEEAGTFLKRAQRAGSDPVGFGARLLDADPWRWPQVNWDREYPRLHLDVAARSHIYGTGMRK
ncbi:MAG TPA: Ger(x)C family spore germination protein [Symbiobacteriaceae bacterium]|jgi:Ger(x)C family germination protein